MDILIIGGTRFFGYRGALALSEAGHDVAIFTRGNRRPPLPDAIEHMIGDRENDEDLERAARARDWDVVWDNMNRTEAHAEAAVRIFDGRCGLFIYTSTLAVYSVCEGIVSPYREEDFDRGRPMVERRGTYMYDYGLGRRAGELVLRRAHEDSGFPCVSVRLPIVNGPRDYSLRAWAYWRRIAEGMPIVLPDGGWAAQRSIYSEDVVSGVRAIIEKGAEVAGRAYNLAGREIISLRTFVEMSADLTDREVEIVDIPRPALRAAGIDPEALSPFSMWANHLHSIAKAQHELGFDPTPLEHWLAMTLDWHLEHRAGEDPPGWELLDQERALVERWNRLLAELG